MTKDEMENKSRAFITEISEILGLGKPIDILKLCATTNLFFKPLEERITELEKENAELKEQLGDKVMQKRKDKADLVWKLKTANEQKVVQLTKAKEILRKFLDAKSIEETCVAESEAEQLLNEYEECFVDFHEKWHLLADGDTPKDSRYV